MMKVIKYFLILIFAFNSCECLHVAIINGGKGLRTNTYKYNYGGPIEDITKFYVSYNIRSASYGASFGKNRLHQGTHIFTSDYKNYLDENKPFLTESIYKNQKENEEKSELRGWNEQFDRRWRKTTKMPYFANELPSENEILPASVVIGAARAFGLTTLLPLNVASDQPLMYCPDKNLQQAKILLDNKLYWCSDNILHVKCVNSEEDLDNGGLEVGTDGLELREVTSENVEETTSENVEEATGNNEATSEISETGNLNSENSEIENLKPESLVELSEHKKSKASRSTTCFNNEIPCNSTIAYIDKDLVCKAGIFTSSSRIFCDSVTNSNTILRCRFGYLLPTHTSFIPTTEDPNLKDYSQTPETGFIYNAVSFFYDLFKSDKKKPVPIDIEFTHENTTEWLPSAFFMEFPSN